jgi:hypothetical protein
VLTQSAQSNMIATVMFMMTAMLTMLPNSLWKAAAADCAASGTMGGAVEGAMVGVVHC